MLLFVLIFLLQFTYLFPLYIFVCSKQSDSNDIDCANGNQSGTAPAARAFSDQMKSAYPQPQMIPYSMYSGQFGPMTYSYPYQMCSFSGLNQEGNLPSQVLENMTRTEKMVALARSAVHQQPIN